MPSGDDVSLHVAAFAASVPPRRSPGTVGGGAASTAALALPLCMSTSVPLANGLFPSTQPSSAHASLLSEAPRAYDGPSPPPRFSH